jgi:hypothetical protein
VVHTFITPHKEVLELTVSMADGTEQKVLVTAEHPFWGLERGWVGAGQLQGEEAVASVGSLGTLHSAHSVSGARTVYNFEVARTHSYFVGLGGLWVHNAPCVTPRIFSSKDPLVADLANAIERAYPGHVVGVNVPLSKVTGELATDADILLHNAVIQVKSGGGKGLTSQMARTQPATKLPVIGYGPDLGGTLVQNINKSGGLVTRDSQFLIQLVAP